MFFLFVFFELVVVFFITPNEQFVFVVNLHRFITISIVIFITVVFIRLNEQICRCCCTKSDVLIVFVHGRPHRQMNTHSHVCM